jgi:hypothetical protein
MRINFIIALPFLSFSTSWGQTSMTFSKQQMFADFDSLSGNLVSVSPQLHIKKDLWGCDAVAELKKLRRSIDTLRSDFAFYILLRKALNTAQDLHTGIWNEQELWVAKQQQLFTDLSNKTFRFSLPNIYINGKYIIWAPFKIGEDTIKIGTEVIRINRQAISAYLKTHPADEIYQYSIHNKELYYPGFFKNFQTLFTDSLSLTFRTEQGRETTYTVSTHLFTEYFPKKGLKSQDTTRVECWKTEKVLYIRLTSMNPQYIPFLKQEISKCKSQVDSIEKVILDFRGNGGGSDRVWTSLYAELLPSDIIFPLKLDGFNNGLLTKKKIEKAGGVAVLQKEKNPLLKKYPFWVLTNATDTLKPTTTSLRFKGKIFVLAEDYYSSTGSAVAVANRNHSDNIISVGRSTGYFLGVGFPPEIFILPNSKLKYRIAPSMEVTNAVRLQDLMFDQLEFEIPYSVNEFKNKYEYSGSTSSKDYLTQYDSIIKFVLHYKEPYR